MNPKQTRGKEDKFPHCSQSSQQLPVYLANMSIAPHASCSQQAGRRLCPNFANSALVFLLMWTPVVLEAMATEQALCKKLLGSALFSNSITRKKPALSAITRLGGPSERPLTIK